MSSQIDTIEENTVVDIDSSSLESIQVENLEFLHDIVRNNKISPKIINVNILDFFVYDFIQILNNLSLQRVLGESEQQE